MIDKALKGRTFLPHTVEVEKGRLRFFAKVIGETNPIFSDEGVAKAAGYRSLPVPPSFLFALELEQSDPLAWFREVGFDLGRLLHGEQSFVYHAQVCAGDVLSFEPRISDIYDKKNGALEFVVRETRVSNQDGCHVADLVAVFIQRNV